MLSTLTKLSLLLDLELISIARNFFIHLKKEKVVGLQSIRERVETANEESVKRMMDSDPLWVDIVQAREIMKTKKKLILHAGPPIDWVDASGPLRGAIIGAVIYEGWADNENKASKLVSEGEVKLDCTHHYNAVGPMAGVISPSMPLYELWDRKFGNRTYSNMNEGIGKVLRYGAYSEEVIRRLRWIADVFSTVLKEVVKEIRRETQGLPIRPLIAQALSMGDECHNRYIATTSLFAKYITPFMLRTGFDKSTLSDVAKFIDENNFTTLNIGMAAAKAMTLAGHNIRYSTIVSVMSRNGTHSGIWISGLGNRWFTAKAPIPKGIWFPGYSESDANPDIGDSAITETAGFGGFAMAAAPAIVSWVGGSVQSTIDITNKMYEITFAKHKYFQIPFLNFKGTPIGIDLRKVLKTGIVPILNTGIAHREAGIGQIGAGTVSFPFEAFKKAFEAFVEEYGL